MKKFFFSFSHSSFPEQDNAVVVVSKDAIKRANARLMGEVVSVLPELDDPYVRFQIPRPSREEIAEAGAHAFRKLTPAG